MDTLEIFDIRVLIFIRVLFGDGEGGGRITTHVQLTLCFVL